MNLLEEVPVSKCNMSESLLDLSAFIMLLENFMLDNEIRAR